MKLDDEYKNAHRGVAAPRRAMGQIRETSFRIVLQPDSVYHEDVVAMACKQWQAPKPDAFISYAKLDCTDVLLSCSTKGSFDSLAGAIVRYVWTGERETVPKSIEGAYLGTLPHLDSMRRGAASQFRQDATSTVTSASTSAVTSASTSHAMTSHPTSEAATSYPTSHPTSDEPVTQPVVDQSMTSFDQTGRLPAETSKSLGELPVYSNAYGNSNDGNEEIVSSIDYGPSENSNATLTTQTPMDMLDASQQMKVRNKADTLARKGYDYEEMEQTLAATMVHDGEDHMMQQVGRLMNAAQQGQVVDVSTGEISPTYTHDGPQLYAEDRPF